MKKVIALFLVVSTFIFAASYKDGTYTVQNGKKTFWDHNACIEMMIKDGAIADVKYTPRDAKSKFKQEEEAAIAKLKEQLLTKQNPKELTVDGMAGASEILKNFKKLSTVALKQAEAGDTSVKVVK